MDDNMTCTAPSTTRKPVLLRLSALLGIVAAGSAVTTAARPEPPAVTRPAPTAAQLAFFEAKVRPVLAEQCYSCHGPAQQLGGIRLDKPELLAKVLTPGDPEHSRLIKAIRYNGDVQMPPSGKRPDVEIAALTEWVKAGAAVPVSSSAAPTAPVSTLPANWEQRKKFWSFQPVRRSAIPKVKNAAWVQTPIDSFILSALENKGLKPAPVADRRTLIRRAYFDLTGLAPTPEQIDAFLADKSPDAWAKVVDGLLASPHYGERWGRHWLDVARYADSNGLDENTAFGYAWRYRDYVVDSLNKDKPYKQFVQEQIAGDLMNSGANEEQRNERIMATCFLTLGPKVLAEPDKAKMAMDIVDEQIDVTSKAVMGLTVTCARCHDHKFDPISTKDYYALAGIFKSTRTMQSLNTVARVYERKLDSAALEAEIKTKTAALEPLNAAVMSARHDADTHLAATLVKSTDKYLAAALELDKTPGVLLPLAERPQKPGDPERKLIEATSFARGNAVRDNEHYGKDLGVIITNQSPVSAEWDVTVPTAGPYQLELRYAAEESRPVHILVNGAVVSKDAAGDITGSWMPEGQRWEAEGIYPLTAGVNRIKIERTDGPIPHFSRLLLVAATTSVKPASRAETTKVADALGKRDGLIPAIIVRCAARIHGSGDLAAARARIAVDAALVMAPDKSDVYWTADDEARVKTAQTALDLAKRAIPMVPVAQAVEDTMKPEDVRVHIRGSTENLGDVVPRGFPAVLALAQQPEPAPNGSGRLALAQWLTDPRHPLTSRVAVNRIWQHLFGIGLVGTPDNYGLRGEAPSNPALLDYLASIFPREQGWSQKKMIREIMLSSVYKQSCTSPAMVAKASKFDPENRLLWRMNRRRLDAEPYRDAMLQVAGKLDLSMGGSLLTIGDAEYVTNDQSNDKALYGSPRRSLYLPVIRNSLYDLYQSFDFGDGSTVNGLRAVTVVAPQALLALNSPLVRDASASFAANLLALPTSDDGQRIRRAYLQTYGRAATPAEVTRVEGYIARYSTAVWSLEPDPIKRRQRAYQSFCQALFASNEFLYLD